MTARWPLTPKPSGSNPPLPERGWIAAHYGKGKINRALSDFNKALELDLRQSEAWFNRAVSWKGKGELSRALADFDQFIPALEKLIAETRRQLKARP